MKKGDELIYSEYGFKEDGNPTNEHTVELLRFDSFITVDNTVKMVGTNNDNILRVVKVDGRCKSMGDKEKPLLG